MSWARRGLSRLDYVYVWADGVHVAIRLEEDRLCCLVLVGVRADGRKELVSVGDGGGLLAEINLLVLFLDPPTREPALGRPGSDSGRQADPRGKRPAGAGRTCCPDPVR